MFGLMTKARARRIATEAMGYGATRAMQEAQRTVDAALQELTPAVVDLRNRADQLERDLEISREREAEALAEVRRLREVNRMVATQLVELRGMMSCSGHAVTDDFGTEFFIFDPVSPAAQVPGLAA